MFLSRIDRSALIPIFNYHFVCMMLGRLCLLQIPFLLLSIAVSFYYNDGGLQPLFSSAGIMLGIGLLFLLAGRSPDCYNAGRREGMLSVTLSWLVVSLIGMLPYKLGGYVPSVADAFFEAISGFTTTGATIFSSIESLPRSILLWRSITQWEGGIGIVVFAVAILPILGGTASQLFVSETTGVTHERFTPRSGTMAKWLYGIYFFLTLLCILLFWVGPMSLYDAVCHGLTCISTGGFSTKNASLAAFDSRYIEGIAALFMFLGSTNFALLFYALRKKHYRFWEDTELRWYIALILTLTLLSAFWLLSRSIYPSFGSAFHISLVQIVSLISTTGYTVADYDWWLSFFGFIACFSMFVAGCAGSTSGGLKVIRFVILIKNLGNEFRKRVHPNAVLPVRIDGHPIQGKVVHQVLAFFFAYLALMIFGAVIVSLEGYSLSDTLSVAIASISNSGPALGSLGPTEDLGALSSLSKVTLSLLMVLGRLEIFTVLTIFHPSFWKH